jgi:preprotein translocase subunit SecB
MLPLINVNEFLLHSVSLSPNDKFRPEDAVKCQVETGFRADRDPTHDRRFGIRLSLRYHGDRMTDANLPYHVRIMLEGYFECPLAFEGQVPKNVILNALMILYGIARGIIGQTTASAVNGKFVLPSLAFDDLVNRAESTPDRTVETSDPTPVPRKSGRRKKSGA